jgi:hypothetical protein
MEKNRCRDITSVITMMSSGKFKDFLFGNGGQRLHPFNSGTDVFHYLRWREQKQLKRLYLIVYFLLCT